MRSYGRIFMSKNRRLQMDVDVLSYFLTQGPFAVLFIWLLIQTQKRNREREDQLYDTLNEFAKRYDIVIEKLDDIKGRLPPR